MRAQKFETIKFFQMRWWVAVVGLLAAVEVVGASKILFLSPISSKSHKNFYMGIINSLAARGHQVGSIKTSFMCIVYVEKNYS